MAGFFWKERGGSMRCEGIVIAGNLWAPFGFGEGRTTFFISRNGAYI